MGWRGWVGPWPGRGPFSYLPPWLRPGWLFGRGACFWLFSPYFYGYVSPYFYAYMPTYFPYHWFPTPYLPRAYYPWW